MRYKFMRFPGGRMKAVTLSYDDGIRADLKLCDVLKKYGLKCTFNINTSTFGRTDRPDKLSPAEIKEHILDAGHEVAVHGEQHIAPGIAEPVRAITDVLNCRLTLEKEFGMIIRGMAYPDSGISRIHANNNCENIFSYLKNLGIVYSRTLSGDNNTFMMPNNFYAWMPTAHHKNPKLMEWAREFVELEPHKIITRRYPRLFYLWGHSYEFDQNLPDNNWGIIEEFAEFMGNREDIWYATNIEIYDYIQAYNQLIFSMDYTKVYNPTCTTLYFKTAKGEYQVKPGETVSYEF